jgi:hypothetical protein
MQPAAARTFYNVADALAPGDGVPGVDLAPFVAARIAGRGRAAERRLGWLLLAVEWEPRVMLRGTSGFSWLPRAERRRALARWERSRIPLRRRGFAWLAELVREGGKDASGQSLPGA